MNCHIPAKSRLTCQQKKVVREYNEKVQGSVFTRYLKLCAVILHTKFGFGHDRIADFLGAMSKAACDAEKDEIFWKHIDDVMIDELKFKDWERENYKEVDR